MAFPRKINATGLELLKQWEGLRTTAYKDSGGVWTIGYGHTASAGKPHPKSGMKITKAQAEDILMRDLRQYEQAVNEAVKVPLSDSQFAALVSFCYNVGADKFRKSTLLKKLNRGDYNAVPAELMKWTRADGKRLQGLVNRRAAEVGLWAKGEFVASHYIKPEAVNAKPVVTDPENLKKNPATSKTVWTWLTTAVAAPLAAFGNLDWRVQLAIIAVIVGFAIYGIKRRVDLSRIMRKLHEERDA